MHALHKLQAADESWGRTLSFINSETRSGRIPHDLFEVQTRIMDKVAKILDEEDYGRVPPMKVGKAEQHRVFKSSFAQPPQMWSTHPASADREENAKRRYLTAPHDKRSAWLLFDHAAAVKEKITAHLIGKTEAKPATAEETFKSLDENYSSLQYNPRYRGVYLGRSIVRHADQVTQLYQGALRYPNVLQALDALYAPQLSDDLDRLRDLVQERVALEALRDRVYKASGGRIVFRGREIPRRQLPAAIRDVLAEEEEVRQRVLAHDRQCRATHIAAAATLGGGWREYLIGLIAVMHYVEHTLADLRDAHGLLVNVYNVVIADGKISKRERKRLIAACNMLHGVLAKIHEQKNGLVLDPAMCQWLGVNSWTAMLGEFKLSPATDENLGDWMNVIDGWVDQFANPLYRISDTALELLLTTEAKIEKNVRESTAVEAAPAASHIPDAYPTLLPGQERKRQTRLDLWDRFQTADGFIPGLLRLMVAGALVGGVLIYGSGIASHADLTIYNGLDREVLVTMGKQQLILQPNMALDNLTFELGKPFTIEARTRQGEVIEHFTPALSGHVEHYVYNVAGASPLVEWTASYGTGDKRPPRFLDAPRWSVSTVDHYFSAPPETVKTKGGVAYRQVLEGMNGRPAEEVMSMLTSDEARKQVIHAHAKWDNFNGAKYAQWKELENRLNPAAQP